MKIQDEKAKIDAKLNNVTKKISSTTFNHIYALHSKYKNNAYFSRTDVESLTNLKTTQAYKLIKLLLELQMLEPVKGQGKGKYRFIPF